MCHRKWSSDLMSETMRCWLKPFTNTEYSPGMKKCHSWGTPLFIGLVLVQVICIFLFLFFLFIKFTLMSRLKIPSHQVYPDLMFY